MVHGATFALKFDLNRQVNYASGRGKFSDIILYFKRALTAAIPLHDSMCRQDMTLAVQRPNMRVMDQ